MWKNRICNKALTRNLSYAFQINIKLLHTISDYHETYTLFCLTSELDAPHPNLVPTSTLIPAPCGTTVTNSFIDETFLTHKKNSKKHKKTKKRKSCETTAKPSLPNIVPENYHIRNNGGTTLSPQQNDGSTYITFNDTDPTNDKGPKTHTPSESDTTQTPVEAITDNEHIRTASNEINLNEEVFPPHHSHVYTSHTLNWTIESTVPSTESVWPDSTIVYINNQSLEQHSIKDEITNFIDTSDQQVHKYSNELISSKENNTHTSTLDQYSGSTRGGLPEQKTEISLDPSPNTNPVNSLTTYHEHLIEYNTPFHHLEYSLKSTTEHPENTYDPNPTHAQDDTPQYITKYHDELTSKNPQEHTPEYPYVNDPTTNSEQSPTTTREYTHYIHPEPPHLFHHDYPTSTSEESYYLSPSSSSSPSSQDYVLSTFYTSHQTSSHVSHPNTVSHVHSFPSMGYHTSQQSSKNVYQPTTHKMHHDLSTPSHYHKPANVTSKSTSEKSTETQFSYEEPASASKETSNDLHSDPSYDYSNLPSSKSSHENTNDLSHENSKETQYDPSPNDSTEIHDDSSNEYLTASIEPHNALEYDDDSTQLPSREQGSIPPIDNGITPQQITGPVNSGTPEYTPFYTKPEFSRSPFTLPAQSPHEESHEETYYEPSSNVQESPFHEPESEPSFQGELIPENSSETPVETTPENSPQDEMKPDNSYEYEISPGNSNGNEYDMTPNNSYVNEYEVIPDNSYVIEYEVSPDSAYEYEMHPDNSYETECEVCQYFEYIDHEHIHGGEGECKECEIVECEVCEMRSGRNGTRIKKLLGKTSKHRKDRMIELRNGTRIKKIYKTKLKNQKGRKIKRHKNIKINPYPIAKRKNGTKIENMRRKKIKKRKGTNKLRKDLETKQSLKYFLFKQNIVGSGPVLRNPSEVTPCCERPKTWETTTHPTRIIFITTPAPSTTAKTEVTSDYYLETETPCKHQHITMNHTIGYTWYLSIQVRMQAYSVMLIYV